MNLNKLSIAVVLSALAINGAFAEEITYAPESGANSGYMLIAACPVSNNCPEVVTPTSNQKCQKCHERKDRCKCKKHKRNACDNERAYKQDRTPTCNLQDPIEPAPCKSRTLHICNDHYLLDQQAYSPCENKVPTGAACPMPHPDQKAHMMQSYAYPAAVYGTNQMIGETDAGIYIGQAPQGEKTGIPVARGNEGITGAAACPCVQDYNKEVTIDVENTNTCNMVEITTENSMEATKRTLQPYSIPVTTGAAAPLVSAFEDVPSGFWAGCDINKLTENNIIAGYPDRTFKPNLPVSRAEMATLTVKGFNLLNSNASTHKSFKDVPRNFWASRMIDKEVANELMEGYSDTMFMPNKTVSRAEAFTILSKGINCGMSDSQANEILNKYCDANEVPNWAKIPVAKAIQAGALNDSPKPDMINPNKDASRAEIASMLENIRVSLGYSNVDKVTSNDCGTPTGAAAFIENEQTVKLPTLALNFNDEINAKSANVGDRFAAKTTEDITLDGQHFPCGSTVRGKILEVNRPSGKCKGSLKLSFDSIQHGSCKADLPQQVLSAQVEKTKTPNIFSRIVSAPFTWTGAIVGTVGRTVGGAIVSAGNAVENVVGGVGTGTGEILQGQFMAAGRSYGDSIKNLIKAPIDTTRTALSGTIGLFQLTGDEVAYLVDPNGAKISSVNPREKVTVAFGCKSNY